VIYYIDDTEVSVIQSEPYSYTWDNSTEAEGSHTLKVVAYDDNNGKANDKCTVNLICTVTDIDGNAYKIIEIGNQVWMAENLRTTKYSNGSDVPLITDDAEWALGDPGYCWYNNDSATHAETYGALYNFYAMETTNICPEGWHVPSDTEYMILEMSLGMSEGDANSTNWRCTDEGGKL